MSEAFESIMRGLGEVKAHREGKLKLKETVIEIAPLPQYDAKMVKTLRVQLGFSQFIFASVLGVSKKTIEAWEAGRNVPSGAASRFLAVIGKDKSLLTREKIVVYNSTVGKTYAGKTHTIKSRAAKARPTKAAIAH